MKQPKKVIELEEPDVKVMIREPYDENELFDMQGQERKRDVTTFEDKVEDVLRQHGLIEPEPEPTEVKDAGNNIV